MSLRIRPDRQPGPSGGPRAQITERIRTEVPISRLPQPPADRMDPTWRLAKPGRIARTLEVAQNAVQAGNSGGWYVAGTSSDVGATKSITRTIGGREVVFWRDSDGTLIAGPGACPHLGALMTDCTVVDGTMYCRWHGLALNRDGDPTWRPYRAHDDGVLIWVGLATAGEPDTEAPVLPPRPPLAQSLAAVVTKPGVCEPMDVIANRLDPWHGAWFHPYSFSHLIVDDEASDDHTLVVDVTFRLSKTWGVPVRAEFSCPDTRTIVMRITEGEGTGSVVETHATPLGLNEAGLPLTMVTEATIAYSPRPGFAVAHWLGPVVRPLMRRTQAKLWIDDLVYAERRYELRRRGEFPG